MKNKFNLLIWYIFLILFLEIVYKFFIFETLIDLKLITIIFFSLPFAFLFYIISSIFNKTVNKIITVILNLFISLIFISQFIYYQFYKSIFSVYSAFLGTGQALGEFGNVVLDFIVRYWYVIFIMLIPILLFSFLGFKYINYEKNSKKEFLIIIISFLLLYGGNHLYLQLANSKVYSAKKLYYEIHSSMITINKLGLLTMEKLDVKRYIFGFEERMHEVTQINENEDNLDLSNKLNINFNTLIENESNESIKNMHIYFKNSDYSLKNEYTGLFKNKNLIYIIAEGLDISAIRKDITPTLYMMLNSGFIFKNYYQPLYPVSTSDGEYMLATSLIPKESIWSFYASSKISMPFSIGNMFKNEGYLTNGYHNHTYNYYNRDESHPNIGLNYMGCGNGLEKRINCNIWPESDVQMIKATTSDYMNSEKFMTYYMTVSGHLRYNFYNSMALKNKEEVIDLPYSDSVKAYLATNIELDKALENLIDDLKSSLEYENTLIVVSPDHYPYGLTESELNEISKEDRSDKFNLYHTSLIMYNPNLETKIIEEYVSSIDVLPTVYNLFGIDYDSRLLMGRDIFSDSEKIVMLSDRSWITNKGRYDSVTDTFEAFEENITDEYVNKINEKVYQKFLMSSYILDTDYYSRIGI